jgi:hypothetical protein
MGKVIVRYKVKPDKADENVSLVKAVYADLNANKPAGLRYATFVAEDGLTFFHMASIEGDANPLAQSDAFKAFQKDIKERCDEPPAPIKVSEIGSFNFFG